MTIPRILVIKLGALGDFVQAFGPFAAIRAHHATAEITLLTTRPFAELAVAAPYFDHVWLDDKPKLWQVGKWAALRARLKGGRFDRVYDLQTSDRSSSYFRLMGKGVEWSGIAKDCSHPHANPLRDAMHTMDRQAEQLAMAGVAGISQTAGVAGISQTAGVAGISQTADVAEIPAPDLAWTLGDSHRFGLPRPYALLCPGGAPHRPAKRWPRFAELADWLAGRGVTPVLLGTDNERAEIDAVRAACPQALDLSGRTSFLDILGLAREAMAAVGNDTGPMHLIAAAQCPSVVLFSHESDPTLCAPRGRVTVLRVPSLADLPVTDVAAALVHLSA